LNFTFQPFLQKIIKNLSKISTPAQALPFLRFVDTRPSITLPRFDGTRPSITPLLTFEKFPQKNPTPKPTWDSNFL
jgi:hypothetical protein